MSPARRPRIAAWLAALAGLALTLAAFWPGYLSWDSAFQWWQARGGGIDTTHPPVMVRAWQLAGLALPLPGGVLLLQAALWWGVLALFANALGGGAVRRVAIVLGLGLWPPLLAVLPHLWKDVWMAAFFALAVACLARDIAPRARGPIEASPRKNADAGPTRWRIAALLAIAAACAFRLNALPAALPLLAVIAWRMFPLWRLAACVATLVFVGVVLGAGKLLNLAPGARDTAAWPSVAMWDIAAVSIAEDRLLFPPDWVDPALTVADLRRDFRPEVNVPSFTAGQLKLNYYYDYTPAQFAQLRAAWWSLPRDHTRAWLDHRARLSAFLFGLRPAAHPDSLVLAPGVVAYGDNPPVARNTSALNTWLQRLLDRLVDTPLFAGLAYVVLALALLLRWAWRRDGGLGALSGATAASALLLAAPLTVLSPSSDFRYLLWLLLGALMALVLRLAAGPGRRGAG